MIYSHLITAKASSNLLPEMEDINSIPYGGTCVDHLSLAMNNRLIQLYLINHAILPQHTYKGWADFQTLLAPNVHPHLLTFAHGVGFPNHSQVVDLESMLDSPVACDPEICLF